MIFPENYYVVDVYLSQDLKLLAKFKRDICIRLKNFQSKG